MGKLVVCYLLITVGPGLAGCSRRTARSAVDSGAPDSGAPDSGAPDSGATGIVPPDQPACCNACEVAGEPCQRNGCFNGYYCNTDSGCRCMAPPTDGGTIPPPDAGPTPTASLRITEINPAGSADWIELVAASGGALEGITLTELTNSGYSFRFPGGYEVADDDVIVLHLGGDCTDGAGDRTECGDAAPFTDGAWDFGTLGSLTYSGKVLEILAPDGTPMDGVPFVESHGTAPADYVAAVEQLQSDRVWDASVPCVDDPESGLARDRYCRNISVLWDELANDGSNSVMRIAGDAPLDVPGHAAQWSAALPSTWGTF